MKSLFEPPETACLRKSWPCRCKNLTLIIILLGYIGLLARIYNRSQLKSDLKTFHMKKAVHFSMNSFICALIV